MGILSKIKQANLIGRGGAGFSVAQKWFSVAKALESKSAGKCYVVCNAAEGEPGVAKDGYILEHYPEKVIDGLKIAIDFLSSCAETSADQSAVKGYIYLNYSYSKKLSKKLSFLLKDSKIEIFVKPIKAGYIGGEESAVLNAIEGRRIEPRLKPPFPAARGLWNCPTLINNVETFYNISLVASGDYKNNRFYTITGDCPNEGVFNLLDSLTIEKVLKQTNNYPKFAFFVQTGGLASGEVLNSSQLKLAVSGAGSIAVYSLVKNNFKKVVKGWLDFFVNETCGQCTPCREGTYRLNEIFNKEKIDWELFNNLLDNLSDASICALGGSVAVPIKSFIRNVYPTLKNEKN